MYVMDTVGLEKRFLVASRGDEGNSVEVIKAKASHSESESHIRNMRIAQEIRTIVTYKDASQITPINKAATIWKGLLIWWFLIMNQLYKLRNLMR